MPNIIKVAGGLQPLQHNILNEKQRQKFLDEFNLEEDVTAQTLICAIFRRAALTHQAASVLITPEFVSKNYWDHPQTLATTGLNHRTAYANVRSQPQGRNIIVIGSDLKLAVTFKDRVIMDVQEQGFYKSERKFVPNSYRYRDGYITNLLSSVTGLKIIAAHTHKYIIWKKI